MAENIKNIEPSVILTGDTYNWKKSFSAYPASDGWELSYSIGGAVTASLTFGDKVTADGDGFLISIPAATTSPWTSGECWFRGKVTKGGETFTVSEGTFTITNYSSNFSRISHVKKVLDAIEAVLEMRATKDQESYTIKGRSVSNTPIEDLIKLKSFYQDQYNKLKSAERASKGLNSKKIIHMRFKR